MSDDRSALFPPSPSPHPVIYAAAYYLYTTCLQAYEDGENGVHASISLPILIEITDTNIPRIASEKFANLLRANWEQAKASKFMSLEFEHGEFFFYMDEDGLLALNRSETICWDDRSKAMVEKNRALLNRSGPTRKQDIKSNSDPFVGAGHELASAGTSYAGMRVPVSDRYVSTKDNQEKFDTLLQPLEEIIKEWVEDHPELRKLNDKQDGPLTEIRSAIAQIKGGTVNLEHTKESLLPSLDKVQKALSTLSGVETLVRLVKQAIDAGKELLQSFGSI